MFGKVGFHHLSLLAVAFPLTPLHSWVELTESRKKSKPKGFSTQAHNLSFYVLLLLLENDGIHEDNHSCQLVTMVGMYFSLIRLYSHVYMWEC